MFNPARDDLRIARRDPGARKFGARAQMEATGERGFAMGHDDVLSEVSAVDYVTGVLTDTDRAE